MPKKETKNTLISDIQEEDRAKMIVVSIAHIIWCWKCLTNVLASWQIRAQFDITEISSIQDMDIRLPRVECKLKLGSVCQTNVSVTIINLGLRDFMYIMYIIKKGIN